MAMRRLDREAVNIDEKLEILAHCKVCRLGMIDETAEPVEPYIVPLNFGYEYAGGVLYLYFHSAGEGRKVSILKNSTAFARPVCFEMDGAHQLVPGPQDCNYSYRYESVIGKGTVEFLDDREGKIRGLNFLMRHQTGEDRDFVFDDTALGNTTVFRLRAGEWRAKRH
jgi:nitroimidazol reductase NimA-like FMN-containing flavoprotein (pyridoxamine 5'-phosphate oxidase superfamily)